jgi:hypothetical protein
MTDTPEFISYPASYDALSDFAGFRDTLMYEPFQNGVWIPLGYMTGAVQMAATNNGSNTWGLTYTPTSTTVYTPSSAYPAWAESDYYLWLNYGQHVQTAPPP